jgi:uncharacterized protein YukE
MSLDQLVHDSEDLQAAANGMDTALEDLYHQVNAFLLTYHGQAAGAFQEFAGVLHSSAEAMSGDMKQASVILSEMIATMTQSDNKAAAGFQR